MSHDVQSYEDGFTDGYEEGINDGRCHWQLAMLKRLAEDKVIDIGITFRYFREFGL